MMDGGTLVAIAILVVVLVFIAVRVGQRRRGGITNTSVPLYIPTDMPADASHETNQAHHHHHHAPPPVHHHTPPPPPPVHHG